MTMNKEMKTVKFTFRQKSFNAHTAWGEFTYNTEENALKAYHSMKADPRYSNVTLC